MAFERIKLPVRRAEHRKRVFAIKSLVGALTPREKEVLTCIIQDMANKQIAAELDMSIRTVEVHRHRIMRKMEADTSISLACDVQCAHCDYFDRANEGA